MAAMNHFPQIYFTFLHTVAFANIAPKGMANGQKRDSQPGSYSEGRSYWRGRKGAKNVARQRWRRPRDATELSYDNFFHNISKIEKLICPPPSLNAFYPISGCSGHLIRDYAPGHLAAFGGQSTTTGLAYPFGGQTNGTLGNKADGLLGQPPK